LGGGGMNAPPASERELGLDIQAGQAVVSFTLGRGVPVKEVSGGCCPDSN